MQKLIISSEAHDAHEHYSCCIKAILEYIASGNELYLSNKEKSPINLNQDEIIYFSKLLDLYNTTDFLLAKPQHLNTLIKDEKDICNNVCWPERPQKINNILKRIFGYDEGFSKGNFIHLHKSKSNKYTIQYTQCPPDDGTEWGAVEFIKSLNVDYCVYCNEALLYHEDGKGNRSYSHSSLDHFYNKSSYPFLALTLTNLIPSCTQCNSSIKSTRELPENALNPYEGSFHESVHFHLEDDTDMSIGLGKILNKNYSINDLKISRTRNSQFSDNAMILTDFFDILNRYKKINDLEKSVIKIATYNIFHNKLVFDSLSQIEAMEPELFPELHYKESEISFCKIIY